MVRCKVGKSGFYCKPCFELFQKNNNMFFFTIVKCPVLNFTHKQKAFHQKRKQNKNGQLEADTAELETDKKATDQLCGWDTWGG